MKKSADNSANITAAKAIRRPKQGQGFRLNIYRHALVNSIIKLNPVWMARNPVMFVVEVGSVLTTALWIQALFGFSEARAEFIGAIALWLWLTVYSPTSRKLWRRDKARHRRPRCAWPARSNKLRSLPNPSHGSNYESVPSTTCAQATFSWQKPATLSQ